jgi:hypothetical protein
MLISGITHLFYKPPLAKVNHRFSQLWRDIMHFAPLSVFAEEGEA